MDRSRSKVPRAFRSEAAGVRFIAAYTRYSDVGRSPAKNGRSDLLKRAVLTNIDFDQALTALTGIDPCQGQGRIVELRNLGGPSEQEVGEVLLISRRTVTREWQPARAWLYRPVMRGRTNV